MHWCIFKSTDYSSCWHASRYCFCSWKTNYVKAAWGNGVYCLMRTKPTFATCSAQALSRDWRALTANWRTHQAKSVHYLERARFQVYNVVTVIVARSCEYPLKLPENLLCSVSPWDSVWSSQKTAATVFWGRRGVRLCNFMSLEEIINAGLVKISWNYGVQFKTTSADFWLLFSGAE